MHEFPIAMYLSTNWLHRLGYRISKAANYKLTNILREATRILNIIIPCVCQQQEINLKPGHIIWEMSYSTGACLYCIEWGNLRM